MSRLPLSYAASSVEDDVTKLFEDLGFETDWDVTHAGIEYYEILDGNDLIAQIDFGPTADQVKEAILVFATEPAPKGILLFHTGPDPDSSPVKLRATKQAVDKLAKKLRSKKNSALY